MNHKEYWRRMLQGQLYRIAWIAGCALALLVLPYFEVESALIGAALIGTIVVLSLQVLADMWAIAFVEWCKDMGNGLGTVYGAVRSPRQRR